MASEDKAPKESAQEDAGWQYKPSGTSVAAAGGSADDPKELDSPRTESVEWTASEFVAHEKGPGWYLMLAGAAVAVAAIVYFVTRDVFSVVVILVMAAIFGVSGSHKPRVITYKVDASGLTVGSKFYPFSAYKSFSTPQEGPFTAITLMPLKHLAFPVGAYLAPESQDKVLEIVAAHLPMEQGEPGTVDSLMRRLRF